MELKGIGVLVTGGGTGIGQAIALALAEDGCKVAITGRREARLRETAGLWNGQPRVLYRRADVADRGSIENLFAWVEKDLGAIHILVNCAGVNIKKRSMEELDPADWDRVLQVNATGAFDCIRRVLPQMRQRQDGLIINVSSTAGKRAATVAGVAYCASKFAMTALGTGIGLEEAKNGIRLTNIYPGEVNTPILDERPEPVSEEHRASILQPEDIAAAVLMVARLPARAHVPELLIKPTLQIYA